MVINCKLITNIQQVILLKMVKSKIQNDPNKNYQFILFAIKKYHKKQFDILKMLLGDNIQKTDWKG